MNEDPYPADTPIDGPEEEAGVVETAELDTD